MRTVDKQAESDTTLYVSLQLIWSPIHFVYKNDDAIRCREDIISECKYGVSAE